MKFAIPEVDLAKMSSPEFLPRRFKFSLSEGTSCPEVEKLRAGFATINAASKSLRQQRLDNDRQWSALISAR